MYFSHPSRSWKNARRGRADVEILLNTIVERDWSMPSMGSATCQKSSSYLGGATYDVIAVPLGESQKRIIPHLNFLQKGLAGGIQQ